MIPIFSLEESRQKIQAFYPIYLPDVGNITQVDTTDGRNCTIPISLRSFLNNFCAAFAIDRKAMQHKYGRITGQKTMVPLPLGFQYVFVPLKLRQPLAAGDGAVGYVQLHRIKQVVESNHEPFKSKVIFTDNRELNVLCSRQTVQNRVQAACFIYDLYLREFSGSSNCRELFSLLGILQKAIK